MSAEENAHFHLTRSNSIRFLETNVILAMNLDYIMITNVTEIYLTTYCKRVISEF